MDKYESTWILGVHHNQRETLQTNLDRLFFYVYRNGPTTPADLAEYLGVTDTEMANIVTVYGNGERRWFDVIDGKLHLSHWAEKSCRYLGPVKEFELMSASEKQERFARIALNCKEIAFHINEFGPFTQETLSHRLCIPLDEVRLVMYFFGPSRGSHIFDADKDEDGTLKMGLCWNWDTHFSLNARCPDPNE